MSARDARGPEDMSLPYGLGRPQWPHFSATLEM